MKLLSLFLIFFLTGCSSTPIHEVNEKYRDVLLQRETNYRIKPGDTISIKFFKLEADFNQTLLVLPDGRTDPYYMDDMVLTGKTVKDLKEMINKYYHARIPENQEISIQITPAAETITLEGQIVRPDRDTYTQPYTPKMTLIQAIGNVGGYKLTACLHTVIVRRSYLDKNHPDVFRINLRDYEDTPEDLYLLPNDHIILERNWLILVRDYITEYVWGFLPPVFGTVVGVLAGASI